jgi:hypothetical protein
MTNQTPIARVQLFDYPLAFVNGHRVQLSSKAFTLLAFLALEGRCLRSRLAVLLFPKATDPLNSLSVLRGEIHRVLGASALKSDKSFLALGDINVDALEFLTASDSLLRSKLYLGEFLRGQSFDHSELEEWLDSQRLRFLALFQVAEFDLAEQDIGSHSWHLAEKRLYALATHWLLPSEDALYLWLLVLGASGQSGKPVLSAFSSVYRSFKHSHGLPLLPRTTHAFELARAGNVQACLALLEGKIKRQSGTIPLLGREDVWARMEAAWQAGRMILLSGEPGVGKSRLALDFAHSKGAVWHFYARPSDAAVPYSTHARNYSTALDLHPGVVLPAWVQIEMARIVPSLGELPLPVQNDQEQLRFFEAQAEAYRFISHHAQIATMLIDDAQYVDDFSAQAGIHLHSKFLPYRSGFPRTIFSFRAGEFKPEVEAGLREWVRLGIADWIDLMPLSQVVVGQCLQHLDSRLEPLAERMTTYTGGNPLLVLETARAILEQPPQDFAQVEFPKLPQVYEMTQRRLLRLPVEALLLAQFVAIIGEQFSVAAAQAAFVWSASQLQSNLELLRTSSILMDLGFSHDLIYEATLHGIPEETREYLHGLALQALEFTGAPAAILVIHALGAKKFALARIYSLQAASEARLLLAIPDELLHLTRASELQLQGF